MVLSCIEEVAAQFGISCVVTTSAERISATLNRITKVEQLPVALINWDINTNITFDNDGFLNNPQSSVTMLMMDKAETTEYPKMLETSENVKSLFISFIEALNNKLRLTQRRGQNAVNNVNATLVPKNGAGQHSGIIATFNVDIPIVRCKQPICPPAKVKDTSCSDCSE